MLRNLEQTLTPTLTKSDTDKLQEDHTASPKYIEKRLKVELFRRGGTQQKGSHYPLCVFTNNPGWRSPDKWSERQRRAEKYGWKKGVGKYDKPNAATPQSWWSGRSTAADVSWQSDDTTPQSWQSDDTTPQSWQSHKPRSWQGAGAGNVAPSWPGSSANEWRGWDVQSYAEESSTYGAENSWTGCSEKKTWLIQFFAPQWRLDQYLQSLINLCGLHGIFEQIIVACTPQTWPPRWQIRLVRVAAAPLNVARGLGCFSRKQKKHDGRIDYALRNEPQLELLSALLRFHGAPFYDFHNLYENTRWQNRGAYTICFGPGVRIGAHTPHLCKHHRHHLARHLDYFKVDSRFAKTCHSKLQQCQTKFKANSRVAKQCQSKIKNSKEVPQRLQ